MLVALITIFVYLILQERHSAVCIGVQHSCPDLIIQSHTYDQHAHVDAWHIARMYVYLVLRV